MREGWDCSGGSSRGGGGGMTRVLLLLTLAAAVCMASAGVGATWVVDGDGGASSLIRGGGRLTDNPRVRKVYAP